MTRKKAIKIIMAVTHCGNRRWVNDAFNTVKKHIAGNPNNVDVCFRVLCYICNSGPRVGFDMPSCRMCNHYKRAHDLETFRKYIAEIPRKLQENYIYKIGVVYGNVLENPKAIKFYFEKVRDNHAAD